MSDAPGHDRHAPVVMALVFAAAVAFFVRALGVEWVFVGEDVVFPFLVDEHFRKRELARLAAGYVDGHLVGSQVARPRQHHVH